MAGEKRPTVATVFGVLNIVFGGIGLLTGLKALFGFMGVFGFIVSLIGFGVSGLLLYAGILLLTNKKNALTFNMYYVLASVVYTVIYITFTMYTTIVVLHLGFALGYIISGLVVILLLNLVYPALVYFLIVRNEEVKKFYA